MKTYMLEMKMLQEHLIGNTMRLTDYIEPKTIKEAIETLNDYFQYTTPDEKKFFNESTTANIMYQYHGLGQKIRNAWLWPKGENADQYSNLFKIFINLNMQHPDDMSGFLLRLFWHYKHESDKSCLLYTSPSPRDS